MGCCGSTGRVDDKGKRRAHVRQASQKGLFSGLALKFPLVKQTFKNVRKVFDAHTSPENRENLSQDKVREVMEALGAKNLTKEDVNKLFNIADLDSSKTISFREFLIAVAVGYYLKEGAKSDHPDFESNKRGFEVIKQAFEKIDADHGGSVDPKELKAALFDVATGRESDDILEARFKELDFDGDGDIYFPEFLYGFVAWVGMVEDEDDDDNQEAEAVKNSLKNQEASRSYPAEEEKSGADDNNDAESNNE